MILYAIAMQAGSAIVGDQGSNDGAAARSAASMHGYFRARRSVVIDSHVVARGDFHARGWRTVSNDELRRRSSYGAPRGYLFRRSVSVDLDHDGRADVVEMVERPRQMALRVAYGGRDRVVVANIHAGRWTDQGLFAAGRDAVMVNLPETGAYFLFQRGRDLRIEYGDY